MNIRLVKLDVQYKELFDDMMNEWVKDILDHHTNNSPYAIFKNDYHDFDDYLNHLEETKEGWVNNSIFFCIDDDLNQFVGAVNIRHELNEYLYQYGGHIGDGIRPTLRNKGYGTKMLSLALKECKKLNINQVLIVCDKDNIASAKTIIKNGGILENEVKYNDKIYQRYWIE